MKLVLVLMLSALLLSACTPPNPDVCAFFGGDRHEGYRQACENKSMTWKPHVFDLDHDYECIDSSGESHHYYAFCANVSQGGKE